MEIDMRDEELFISTLKDCEEEIKDIIGYDTRIDRFYSDLVYSINYSLDAIIPQECQKSVKKLIWKIVDRFESQIRFSTAIDGWNYSELYFDAVIGLKSIMSTGYLPEGSDSEELYLNSLPNYASKFLKKYEQSKINRFLWELTAYIELLIIYHKIAKNNKYQPELKKSVEILISTIKTEKSYFFNERNIQLVGYIGFVLIDYDDENVIEITDEVRKMISNFNNWPNDLSAKILLFIDLLKLEDKLESLMLNKYDEIIQEYALVSYKKRILKPHFLKLITEYAKKNHIRYQVPYFTLSGNETLFFGVVVETIIEAGNHFDTEKRSKILNYQETDLRSTVQLALKIRFKNLATAETFSSKGYTDIYVINPKDLKEHAVIECKIFKGKKEYNESIDQSMKYLQENEGRVILLTFIKNTNYFDTLINIKTAIENHPTYQKNSLKEGVLREGNSWGENYYTSIHKNESGSDFRVHHIYVDIRDEGIC